MQQPAPNPAPAENEAKGGASELITQIHSGLMELMSIMDGAPVAPEDKQQLGQIISNYQSFVEGMTASPNAPKAPAPAGVGVTTPEAGGSPSARPMV